MIRDEEQSRRNVLLLLVALGGGVEVEGLEACTGERMVGEGGDRIDGDSKYLTKMTMDSVSQENRENLLKQLASNREEIRALKAQSLEDLWKTDLDVFLKEYEKVVAERAQEQQGAATGMTVVKKKPVVKKAAK